MEGGVVEQASKERGSLLAEIVATVSVTISSVGMAISLAVLVFAGPIEAGLPRATTAFIVGGGIVTIVISWRSALVPVVAIAQDGPAVVLVALVASLVQRDPDVTTADVMVLIALASALAGVTMVLLGRFGLGQAVRFLPTTVVSAFIAGTGWLLCKGGIEVMIDSQVTLDNGFDLLAASSAKFWLPGLLLGFAVYALSVWPKAPLAASSGIVVVAVVAFFVVATSFSSVSAVEDEGWLIGPFAGGARPSLVTANEVANAPWGALAAQTGGLLSVVVVAAVGLLLNLSGLESLTKHDLDLDRELMITGAANLAIVPIGGLPGFHALGGTVLATRMGAARRALPVAVGVVTVGLGLVGAQLVGQVPRFVAGGLLIAVGIGLVIEWLQGLVAPGLWIERMLSASIVLAIAAIGILEGIVFGVVVACGIFVVRYSRVDPIRKVSSGLAMTSRVDRSLAEADTLAVTGERRSIFEFQGYLFFGSMVRLTESVSDHVDNADESVTDVILDLRHVTGIDSSALVLFGRLFAELQGRDASVHIAGADEVLLAAIAQSHAGLKLYPNLDLALADAEAATLADAAVHRDQLSPTVLPEAVLAAWTWSTVGAGETLLASGDPSDVLIYLVHGRANVVSVSQSGERSRLRQVVGPQWLGEMGFLRDVPRSADVVAESVCEIASITRVDFDRLRESAPDSVTKVVENIALELAQRVERLSGSLTRALE